MARWEAQVPDSKLRPLLLPMRLDGEAWNARGSGYARETPPEALQVFREKLREAAAALKQTEELGKDSPLWWRTLQGVAGASGATAEELDAIFEQAASRFPLYKSIYYTRLDFLLPQWGGSFEAIDRFIDAAVKRTAMGEGEAMYAWLYVEVARKTEERFESSAVEWPRMKKGFEDMVTRHPDTWNRNLYATFACRARDRETTGMLLTQLGDKAGLGAWSRSISTEGCRRFAFTRS
jgi:hypothetical protein